MKWLKENWKDLLKVFTAVVVVFGVVIFPGLSDYATHSFWWKFWDVAAIVCAVVCVVGWVILWTRSSERGDQ